MQNLMKKPLLSGGSDFAMNIPLNGKATLSIEGYCIRLTKVGKAALPKMTEGNLSEAEIAQVRQFADNLGKPFSGKGGLVYQLTCFTNAEDNHTFVNAFNPQKEAGEIIIVECYQRNNADGTPATYEGANGTQPSLSLRITTEGDEESSNTALAEKAITEAE